MKDVLIFLSPAPGDSLSAGVHYGLSLARAHGAHLSVLMAEIGTFNDLPEPDNMQADDATIEQSSPTERVARTAELIMSAAGVCQCTM